MKFIWFAFTLCFGLIGITAFVAWQAHIEAREARKEVLMFRQQQNDQLAAGAELLPGILEAPARIAVEPALQPQPPPLPPASASKPISGGSTAPTAVVTPPTPAPAPAGPEPKPEAPAPLTAQQSHLLTLPAIAKITAVHGDEGFVLIDAGAAKNMAAGMKFDVRRGASVVGRVTVTETIEESEAIADIQPLSVPIGMVLKPGDELVQIAPPP